jgi:hypothetical protein
LLDGYHETKVARVAALGPEIGTDHETGRCLVEQTERVLRSIDVLADLPNIRAASHTR